MTDKEKDLSIKELMQLHKKTLTDEVMLKLQAAFQYDFTNEEACYYAKINPSTYYNYCKWSSEFREKMEEYKSFVAMSAKENIFKAIRGGSIEDSWKYLERRRKDDYSSKGIVKHEGLENLLGKVITTKDKEN